MNTEVGLRKCDPQRGPITLNVAEDNLVLSGSAMEIEELMLRLSSFGYFGTKLTENKGKLFAAFGKEAM